LKKGDKPYWNDAQLSASDSFDADVVVVMLGTNDAKPQNWSHQADFTGDYDSMIDHYRGLGALVYVALPPPVASPGNFQIDPDVLNTQIVPLIRQIATVANAPTIDVYQAFNDKTNLLSDTVHPNADGAKLIAQTVQAALQQGGYGGYAGTGGTASTNHTSTASSTGGTPGSGGVKNTGGTPASGGFIGTGGLADTGGRSTTSFGLGGTLNTGGVATTLVSAGGTLGAGGSARGTGGALTSATAKSTGGQQSSGGSRSGGETAGGNGSAQGGASVASGGTETTGKSSLGGSSSSTGGNTSSNVVATGTFEVSASTGQAGATSSTGGSSAVAVSQGTNPDGCGCRVQGRNTNGFAAWTMTLLSLLLLRRKRPTGAR
jgi:hypothetical protein